MPIEPDFCPESADDANDADDAHHADGADDPAFEVGGDAVEIPDDLDLVTEVADMMSIFAAQRFARVDSMRRNAIADAERYGGAAVLLVERSIRLELASALRITESAATDLLMTGEALVHRYPQVLDSLAAARITERHADTIARALDAIERDVGERILERVLQLAEDRPGGAFRRALRKLIDTERVATLAERYEMALGDRRVAVEAADDGMAWLHAFLPAVEARAIHGRLTAIAKVIGAHEEESRTLDQIRADILGDLLVDGDTARLAPEARGIRATVAVSVPALTLLGQGDQCAGEPAIVEGVGPIPFDRARELCGGAAGWMRILTHPETGIVLSVGRSQYRPPPALSRLVRWRADRCMAPGCGIQAARCELDHTIAWEHGGETSLDNLAPLCTGHHTIKHHGGWNVEQIDGSGGALLWTSPSGRHYRVEPERRVPVFRPSSVGDAPF